MTSPSESVQTKAAFMESVLTKAFHREGQELFESIYTSKPVTWSSDVLHTDLSLPLAADQATIDTWITSNTGYLQKYEDVVLTPDSVSNNEFYYIDDGGVWVKPYVLEYMVGDPITNQPSNGYVLQLKQGVGGASPGTQISPAAGKWWVSPFEGGIHFEKDYTPVDMGWGNITVTVYVWIGDTLATASAPQQVALPIVDEYTTTMFSAEILPELVFEDDDIVWDLFDSDFNGY
jgi:hypothetical protein